MAIALPPPVTPQLAPLTELRAQVHDETLVEYKGVRIHIFGSQTVPAERLRAAITAADNISDAVRAIGSLYYIAGYPAALVSYAPESSKDLYVRVSPGQVSSVAGPPELLDYFGNLKGRAPLTDAAFESDRVLADGYTERAAEQYKPQFRPDPAGGDGVVLDFGEPTPHGHQTGLAASFSNYGNRYAGPYLVAAGLRQSFSSGDEFTFSGIAAARFLGLGGSRAEPYHEGDGSWSRVTRFGVFGLEGRYADFRQRVVGAALVGDLSDGAATWLYPLYSDFQHRLNLGARFERDHETVTTPVAITPGLLTQILQLLGLAPPSGTQQVEVLSELYNSAGLDLSYVQRDDVSKHTFEINAGLGLRKGLGPRNNPLTPAHLDYFLWRPSFDLRYAVLAHWSALASASAQFSGSPLPQQQQFVIGGPTSLHAYEAGAGAGDSGAQFRLAVEWKGYDDSWVEHHGLRPRAFVEYGSSRLHHAVLGVNPGGVELADAGLELEFRFTDWLSGELSGADSFFHQGLTNSPDGLERKYVFFQLAAKY